MGKRAWPRCTEPGCSSVVRRVEGEYRGPRQPEPDGKCSAHKIEDTEFVPTPIVRTEVPTQLEPEDALDESPASTERIESLRDAMRSGLITAEVADLIREQILEGLRASKSVFVTCPDCKHRHPVTLPDLATRIGAASKLTEELEGRVRDTVATAQEIEGKEVNSLLKHREELSDADLARLIVKLEKELADG